MKTTNIMAKDNIRVVQIDTDPAKKSLKDLRNELKQYKDQMANLEEGSDAFLEVANAAGELKHQIDEINESIKGASADFGDMVGNVTNIAAGLTGAFQAVAGGLQAMGIESKAIDESIAKMQGLMAVTQGLGSIDTAIKSLDKLRNSITSTTGAAKLLKAALQPKVFLAIAAAITAVTFAFSKVREKQEEAARVQEEYNKKIERENQLRRESNVKDFLRNLNTELRIKEAIASVKYEDDELKYKKEMLKEYILEMNRAKLELDNVLAVGNSSAWTLVGKNYETELKKWSEYAEQMKTLVQQTKDDIKVLEAEAEARNKKEKNKPTTKKDDKKDLGLVEFTDKDLNEGLARVRKYYEEIYDIQLEQNKRKQQTQQQSLEAEIAIEKNRLTIYAEGSLEYERQLTKIFELEQELKELTNDTTTLVIDRKKQIEELGNAMFNSLKDTVSAFSESSLGITSNWIKSLDEFQLAFQQTMKIVQTEGTVSWTAYGNVAATALGGIGTLLNSLSQEQKANEEEGFENMKKLQIAATVMNMLSGIMSAWTSAMSPSNAWMTVWGQIAMGTAMSALVAGVGGAQIAKIKSQTMDSANPNTNINAKSVNATIIPPVQYSNAIQGASTEGAIKDSKVYVLESDITNTTNKVAVQESENTY